MSDPRPATAASPTPPTIPAGILESVEVRKTYDLGRVKVPVLQGATLAVAHGEWLAVRGSSGSGKSTLLHVLGGLDRVDRADGGEVRFEGRSIRSMGRGELDRYRNREVGFVFQFYHLLPELTVLENAMLPGMVGRLPLAWRAQRPEVVARAGELLDRFGLGHRLRHRPRELSGGERQRVAIARALVNQPRVLLADEPTGNLDEKTGAGILDLLGEEHRRGLCIVMVTHDAAVAARADRVVWLRDGRIEES
ncbi:MAG: ABC transporter ATP-binding protein [Phycisphaerae bacterium]|nr:ABC transporter ATP-binding protein [Phycisphaerae bacterium]